MSRNDKDGSTEPKDPLRFQHIKRLGIAVILGFAVLLAGKFLLVPKSFGEFGHYRGAAITEIRSKQPNHIGKEACLECHTEVRTAFMSQKHKKLSCETCHGAMGAHAEDQTEENSKIHFGDRECLRCHQTLAARPRFMRQIDGAQHFSKETCVSCHAAHNPRAHASKGIMKGASESSKSGGKE